MLWSKPPDQTAHPARLASQAAEAAEEALRLAKEADDELLTMHAMQAGVGGGES